MGNLRPTLKTCNEPGGLGYEATYYRVFQATAACRGLLHGKLENNAGQTCAVGSYFKQSNVAIDSRAIDEIAAYNDSFPKLSMQQRWRKVRAWLRFEVERLQRRKATP